MLAVVGGGGEICRRRRSSAAYVDHANVASTNVTPGTVVRKYLLCQVISREAEVIVLLVEPPGVPGVFATGLQRAAAVMSLIREADQWSRFAVGRLRVPTLSCRLLYCWSLRISISALAAWFAQRIRRGDLSNGFQFAYNIHPQVGLCLTGAVLTTTNNRRPCRRRSW
jgi:hypothetical protein